jgi:hypothetical protein
MNAVMERSLDDVLNAIAALDLDPIKVKLMHAESGKGWGRQHADEVEKGYRRFLELMVKYPDEAIAPTMDIDEFWHYHILDTMKYAEDCQNVFGHFLHHFPYIGLRGDEDLKLHEVAGANMQRLYAHEYGESLEAGEDSQAPESGTAYSMASARPAYSMASARTAYSMASGRTAYSMASARTAYSMASARTAYSMASARPAYSMASARTAYSMASARTTDGPSGTDTAYSMASVRPLTGGATERTGSAPLQQVNLTSRPMLLVAR